MTLTVNANMKVSEQCRIAASNGNQIIGMIRRNITYKDKAVIRLYITKNIKQVWRPYFRKDIAGMLEKYKGEQLNPFQGLEILSTKKD